jgi:hypothetical protein
MTTASVMHPRIVSRDVSPIAGFEETSSRVGACEDLSRCGEGFELPMTRWVKYTLPELDR